MKKTYLQPTIQVVRINTSAIIAMSNADSISSGGKASESLVDGLENDVKNYNNRGRDLWNDQW